MKHKCQQLHLGCDCGAIVVVAPSDKQLAARITRKMILGDNFTEAAVRVPDERHVADQLLRNLEPEMQQVVQLKLEGYTNTEIGDQLAISERTVRRHIQDVRRGMKQTLLDLQGQVDDG